MQQDARSITSGTTLDVDVCIIGAGPAGISLALELTRISSAEVLIVDSGGPEFEADLDALNQGDVVGMPIRSIFGGSVPLEAIRRRQLGGSSNLWGGFCRPLTTAELAPQSLQQVDGWPFGLAELEPWYRQAHEVLLLGPYDYDPTSWCGRLGIAPPLDAGPQFETSLFQKNPTRFGSQYQQALTDSSRVTLLHHATAVNVNTQTGGGHVTSISLATLDGVQLTARAATYVVATGGIETPRLLLASNDVVPAGVGNEHDLVGRYYADHLGVAVEFLLFDPSVSEAALYFGREHATTTPAGLPTTIYVQAGLQIPPEACESASLTGTHIEMILADPSVHPVQTDGVTMPQISELLAASPAGAPGSAGGFRAFLEPVATPDSRVLLSPTTDALGRPRARLDWRVVPGDLARANTAMAYIGDALGAHGLGRMQYAAGWVTLVETTDPAEAVVVTPVGDLPADPLFNSTLHHMCTTRMDTDPTAGVVDVNCRVHTVDNLYIAGSSVFPVPVGHYPTMTIVALAIRLADHLANGGAS